MVCLPCSLLSTSPSAQENIASREPVSEWSKQWLEEVVPYIITPAEREVFLTLPNEVERGRFIERFWKKRDPDPSTPENEYQRQYYLRIALANKFFGDSGIAGWRTERGRIFILLGPPHEIQRDFNTTDSSGFNLFATETWQYWGLPNPKLPYNVEFVFIDKHGNGNYVLDRSFQSGKGGKSGDMRDLTFQFDSMEIMAEAQKNPFENLDKIKTVITTQVTYDLIPFEFRLYAFRGTGEKTHIPLIIEIPYSSLPSRSINGKDDVSLNIIAHVSDHLGRVVAQKSKNLNFHLEPDQKDALKDEMLRFQTSMELDPGTYGIHLIVWDNHSGKTGTSHQTFTAPDFGTGELATSDIVLSSKTGGDWKNSPVLDSPGTMKQPLASIAKRTFRNGEELEVTLEIYNLALNKESGQNSLRAEYLFLQGTKAILNGPTFEPEPSIQRECLIQNSFRLKNFLPGEYTLRVTITDGLAAKSLFKETTFVVAN